MAFFYVMVMTFVMILPSVSCAVESVKIVPTGLERVFAMSGEVAVKQQEMLAKATAETKTLVDGATKKIDFVRGLLFVDATTQQEAAKITRTIIKQNSIAAQAQQKLKRLRERLAQENEADDAQDGYVSRFVSAVKDVGHDLVAPFRYTKNEKNIAQQIIFGLMQQQAKIMEDYQALPLFSVSNKTQLRKCYETAIAQLDDEIYRQQCITGEKKSFKKQVALLAGGAAVAAAAALLAHKFLLPEFLGVKFEESKQEHQQDESEQKNEQEEFVSVDSTEDEQEQTDALEENPQPAFAEASAGRPVFTTELVEVSGRAQEEISLEIDANTELNLDQPHVVDQAKEALDGTEVSQKDQDSQEIILSHQPVEKGYLDIAKDTIQYYLGLGDVSEEVTENKPSVTQVVMDETPGLDVEKTAIEIVPTDSVIVEEKLEIDTVPTDLIENESVIGSPRARPEPVEGYPRALEENPSTSSGRAQRELNAVFTTEPVEVSGRAQEKISLEIGPLLVDEQTENQEKQIENQEEQPESQPEQREQEESLNEDAFNSAVDADGNPIILMPTMPAEQDNKVDDVQQADVPSIAMSLRQEFAAEQEKLDKLKADYGTGWWTSVTLEEKEEQEKKVAQIIEKIVEEDAAWNCVVSQQQDLRDADIIHKAELYRVEMDRLEAEEKIAKEEYNAVVEARDKKLESSFFQAKQFLGMLFDRGDLEYEDLQHKVQISESRLCGKKALKDWHIKNKS